MERRSLRVVGLVLGCATAIILLEVALRLAGLGKPVLYDNRLAYGYREFGISCSRVQRPS